MFKYEKSEPSTIKNMFSSIAKNYALTNAILSVGIFYPNLTHISKNSDLYMTSNCYHFHT